MDLQGQTKNKMLEAVEHFKKELRNLRTNRPSPSILDSVNVEVYGAHMKLKELGNVSSDGRTLVVTAYDAQTAGPIAKAIEKQLNFQTILEGATIRVPVPPMSEEMRKEIAKHARQEAEKAKVVIREIRRKNNDLARKMKADGDMPEDVLKKTEKKIQEFTDQYCKEIDDLTKQKEKEIMEV